MSGPFLEEQAILAAQSGDIDRLKEILDGFHPGELEELMVAADLVGDECRGRLYKRTSMFYPLVRR